MTGGSPAGSPAHGTSAHGASAGAVEVLGTALPLAVLVGGAACYLVLAARRRRDPRGWPAARTGCLLAGAGLLGAALLWPAGPFPAGDFRGHMLQHLTIGMVAPLLLVLAAPITLLLRSLPPARARGIGRLLHRRPVRVLAHPASALVLSLGGVTVLYFTPLYRLAAADEAVHTAVHLHFLLAGYLFAWVVAGPDPAPRRPSVRTRLVVLGLAVAGHAVLSQLLYAGLFTQVPVPAVQRQGAAELMYYGGDLATLALAVALVVRWRPRVRAGAPARSGASAPPR